MSLRVRLAVAFLLLSALPLGGFAVWSYWTSRAALDRAARAQAELAAEALGARVGNASRDLGDRLLNGGVTDFIYVHFFPYIFNVADIAISIGGVLLAARMLLDAGGSDEQQTPTHA